MLSVAAPVGRFSELAQRIRFGLLAALALGAGLGALGAVLIAQLISAPVRRLAGELAQIEARSLDRRLDVRGLDPDLLRLATALNGTLDRLEAAFRQQRELVARASHALRTPLASILATTEVALRRERSTDEYRSTLSDVKSSSSEAAQLVDQLLKLGRADVARASLATERVELAGLGAELLRSFGARASEAQLRLDIALGGAIEADPLRLRELLEALLDNAIRYTRKGGEVGVRSRPAHDGVQIEVWDTGRGIEPSEREQVFERFFRGSAAQQSGQPGTGLGLAIVRAIVDAHGASIRVEPNDGGGTRFVTTWPQTRSSERSSI
jgi:signal transduction histidine kinase